VKGVGARPPLARGEWRGSGMVVGGWAVWMSRRRKQAGLGVRGSHPYSVLADGKRVVENDKIGATQRGGL
jgi:hypothetical protein